MRRNIVLTTLLMAGIIGCGSVVDLHSLTHVRTIGSGGGDVTLDDFTVSIPAGALTKSVTFVVSRLQELSYGALGGVYSVEPEGVEFETTVTVRLSVDVDALPEGMEPVNLTLAWQDGDAWVPLETSAWDEASETLTGLTEHLSLWTAICVPDCPPASCEAPDGCGGSCPDCPPKKLDVLWVMDNSASMCQEQIGLVRSVATFVDGLPSETVETLNMAVITTDALKGQGVFSTTVAEKFPNACAETVVHACAANSECVDAFGDGWQCNPPPSTGGSLLLYNKNGSLNSSCTYTCESAQECCDLFCPPEICGECTHQCVSPGGSDTDKNCTPQPYPCVDVPPGDWEAWAGCHLQVGADQSFTANLESGIKAAWMALDPEGPNAEQAASFHRADAHLLIIFVSDEDDCSVDEEFCSPSYECDDDNDCPGPTECHEGLCCGIVKKDYYNICSLLGEYKGAEHHDCAYDLECQDCETDDDCEPNWTCKSDKKCRPEIFGFNTIASFQQPAGTPIFALASMADYQNRFQSLKSQPQRVMVATIAGDAVVTGNHAASLISEPCLEDVLLDRCQDYLAIKDSPETSEDCPTAPTAPGCEDFYLAKQECARQCYVASKGDNQNPQAKNSYICASDHGTADWGNRYDHMAYMFGVNGLRLNFCAPDGFGALMEQLGAFVSGVME